MKNGYWKNILFAVSAVGLLSTVSNANVVTGAGASFPAPIYTKWADSYNKITGKKINYQSMGSSAGINQIKAKTVDFGASDKPLSDKELKDDNLIQFPTVIGGIVPVVHIDGIKPGDLVLNGDVLAKIFLGEIKKWDDPKIKELNPNLTLPSKRINVVTRADGSGTSYVFTSYLTKVSADWKNKIGAGASVKWPVGTAGKGNEGVSAFVGKLKNSIGYVEYSYSKQKGISYISMINKSGKKVQPDDKSFKAATGGIDWNKSFAQDMTDGNSQDAWPISTATYIIMHTKSNNDKQSKEAVEFFDWALKNGDKDAMSLDYVPFPETVKQIIRNEWKKIQ